MTDLNKLQTIPVQNTTIWVLAGERYPRPFGVDNGAPGDEKDFAIVLETLPVRGADQVVRLQEDGKLMFDLSKSKGSILEYRIDRNVFKDSDGNGVANDDIDNANDDSYLLGSPWVTYYSNDELNGLVAQVTLVSDTGETLVEQVPIETGTVKQIGNPVALLDILPYPHQQNQTVYLTSTPRTVGFYAGRSTGAIVEYRIDRNIFEDSDGDGDPTNDIDNLNDISFTNGDVWSTDYAETDDQIIAQLIVVGQDGKATLVQRELVFADGPDLLTTSEADTVIRLEADKPMVQVGDPVLFTVKGLQQSLEQYLFEWDFNGDDQIDLETEAVNTTLHIYDQPGVFDAKVTIRDREGNFALKSFEVTSKEVQPLSAYFESDINDLRVSFTDQSAAPENAVLSYLWSFGETDEAQYESQKTALYEQNPTYEYATPGTYRVTLTVTDDQGQSDTYSTELVVGEVLAAPTENTPNSTETDSQANASSSFFKRLLKGLLYFFLGGFILIFLILSTVVLAFKIKHSDLTFGEVIDELKHKVESLFGMHEPYEAGHQPDPEPQQPLDHESESDPKPTKPEQAVESSDDSAAWVGNRDVIEGEVVEKPDRGSNGELNGSGHDTTSNSNSPSEDNKGPVPDWLKGV
ncbi:PKD domain-containing protein [Candidatus Peregrinibacteria bacterium]|nr:MAG: PKD domain-containing protein [Candidatus Peregrinibacteria bacterium]